MKSTKRQLIQEAIKCGLEVLNVELSGGDHYRLRLKNAHGVEANFIAPNSCSDNRRATLNRESVYRRFAKGSFNPVMQRGGHQ